MGFCYVHLLEKFVDRFGGIANSAAELKKKTKE